MNRDDDYMYETEQNGWARAMNFDPFADIFAEPPIERARNTGPEPKEPKLLRIVGAGSFLAEPDPDAVALIEAILSDDGSGWLGGEEKLGKTYYALEEALALAFAWPVCGRFPVPTRRRVLLLEEEDPPRRTRRRLRALLRGHGRDPDDPTVQAELDTWFRLSVWSGFSFDSETLVAKLRDELTGFQPAVVYIDCLRKVTLRNLNYADEAGALLGLLDELRREYRCLFRVIHHYRKQQGFRTGRGSQEIGGSYALGAWGEHSLFFEPIGRKAGATRVEIQSKDSPPTPAFRLRIESEGPAHAPTCVRLLAEDIEDGGSDLDEKVFEAIATLPPDDESTPGISVHTLVTALKKSEKTIRVVVKRLCDAERCLVTGKTTKQAKLYGVKAS